MTARVDHAVVSGTFSLDGETHDVDNNVWVIGDDEQCLVIDAPHDVDAILRVVGGRAVKAIVCTHAHDDHVRVAPALRVATGAPILLHPDDRPLWELTHGGDEEGAELWDVDLSDGMTLTIGGAAVTVLHTPGHAPGAVCLYVHDLGCVFTGDTLFEGGPGATGRSYSDADLIVASIRSQPLRPAGRHRRAHRPRRRHHDRRREGQRLSPTAGDASRSGRRLGRAGVPCHHDGMPSRLTALVATLALVATAAACSGEEAPAEKEQDARSTAASSTPTVPPTPSEALGLVEGWGPDRAELDRAAKVVGRMRLPDLAGQVIVADWTGTRAPVAMVRDLHLGGVIAFSANVASADQIRGVNAALTRQVRRKWPLFLGVDQEGGVVERLRGAATRFPTFMSAGAAGDPALTQQAYAASGAELRGLGFTVDFAPDADVTSGPGDPTIGSRSASSRPATVAEHVVAAAAGFSGAGVLPVHQALPRPRLGPGRQPPDPAGADEVARGPRGLRPRAVPRGGRGGAARR